MYLLQRGSLLSYLISSLHPLETRLITTFLALQSHPDLIHRCAVTLDTSFIGEYPERVNKA